MNLPKIFSVELSDRVTKENENGDFEVKYINHQKYPAAITNRSFYLGEQMGLIKGSQMTDLHGVQQVFEAAIQPGENRENALKGLDHNQSLKVIYLAVMGMNKDLKLTFEDFTEKFHESIEDTTNLFTDLVLETVAEGLSENNFAKGLINSTKKKTEKTEKPPDLQS